MEPKPPLCTAEALTAIWQRVLGLSSIRTEDNFFDLGGDPASAARLFREIAKFYDRELSPLVIYQAPTIAVLAALLEEPSPPQFPPMVQLKAGSKAPSVFLAHGLGGNVTEFFELVRHLRTQHPIYGLQARGGDGLDEPFTRIEDMAQYFLGAIKQFQPSGPYFLVGYSLGGLVTLEMAQQLSRSGERVALLAMLDSYQHPHKLSFVERIGLLARRARRQHFPGNLSGKRLPSISGDSSEDRQSRPTSGPPPASADERVRDSAYLALTRYRARYYRGKIRFVKAQIPTHFPVDPAAVWAHLAEEFEVETVPGDHHGMLLTQFESLAAVLSRYLEEANSAD